MPYSPRGLPLDRIYSRVDYSGAYEIKGSKTGTCHMYTGYWDAGGHAGIWYNGRYQGVHRVVWQEKKGPIPYGLDVLHHCDNGACVNIDHLFLGTDFDNAQDKIAKGRLNSADMRGEKAPSSILKETQVLEIRSRWVSSLDTQKMLAARYGVSEGTISDILARRTWKHI